VGVVFMRHEFILEVKRRQVYKLVHCDSDSGGEGTPAGGRSGFPVGAVEHAVVCGPAPLRPSPFAFVPVHTVNLNGAFDDGPRDFVFGHSGRTVHDNAEERNSDGIGSRDLANHVLQLKGQLSATRGKGACAAKLCQ